jgi:hypothetical protein
MRREDTILKTMSALRECINECREAPAPLTVLEQFLEQLRADERWQDEEVRQLETTARRALDALEMPQSERAPVTDDRGVIRVATLLAPPAPPVVRL